MTANYVTQLLPDIEEARVIRAALQEYMDNHGDEERKVDICWKFLTLISTDIRKSVSRANKQ